MIQQTTPQQNDVKANPIQTTNNLDNTLRPQDLRSYVGQSMTKKNIKIAMDAAKKRGDALEHVLLYGPPGLGKTTLANIIAKEMGVGIKSTSGPAIERVGDFGAILTNLQDGEILFIDEIHRLNKSIEEVLYPAMEDHKLDIIVGKGPSAQTLEIDLPKFTLIGATTRYGSLSAPLRNRFGIVHRLEFYSHEEISHIVKRAATILETQIDDEAADTIAHCSRKTPRVANRLLKRARDMAEINNSGKISQDIIDETLKNLHIDHLGLEPTDRFILETIHEKFNGGPVGLHTLATATSEESQTIEDVYEPYLIQLGFLLRTPRGRTITDQGINHLKKTNQTYNTLQHTV